MVVSCLLCVSQPHRRDPTSQGNILWRKSLLSRQTEHKGSSQFFTCLYFCSFYYINYYNSIIIIIAVVIVAVVIAVNTLPINRSKSAVKRVKSLWWPKTSIQCGIHRKLLLLIQCKSNDKPSTTTNNTIIIIISNIIIIIYHHYNKIEFSLIQFLL